MTIRIWPELIIWDVHTGTYWRETCALPPKTRPDPKPYPRRYLHKICLRYQSGKAVTPWDANAGDVWQQGDTTITRPPLRVAIMSNSVWKSPPHGLPFHLIVTPISRPPLRLAKAALIGALTCRGQRRVCFRVARRRC